MALQFNQIPGNIRVPFARFEVNAGRAPYSSISRLLLIGQKTASGTATAKVPVIVSGGEDGLFGLGSQLAAMYKIARANAPFQEIWAFPLDDAQSATAAAGTVTISGSTPLVLGDTIILYVGGVRVSVPVTSAMTSNDIVAQCVSAINACPVQAFATQTVTGVRATGTAASLGTGTASGAGTITATYAGKAYAVSYASGEALATVYARLAAAIPAASGITAVASTGSIAFTSTSYGAKPNTGTVVITATSSTGITGATATLASGVDAAFSVTALNAGTLGNTLRIETKLVPDDSDLADTLLTIVQPFGGASDPTLDLTNLGDDLWDFVAMPYCNHTALDTIDAWLESRWNPISQTYGLNFSAMVGTQGQVQAFTSIRNGRFSHVMPMTKSPQPTYLITASVAAQAAAHLQTPPELSRPLQTIELVGIRPPKAVADRWTTVQKQSFYFAGASGYRVTQDGKVQIERLVSTYQRDAWGNPDQSWLDVNTLAQIMYGVRYIGAYITQTYPRSALVDDNPTQIQGFVTAADIRNAMIHAYVQLTELGVFENADKFEELLIVERNQSDPNRVDVFLPLDAVNQLRILAVNATSYLQFPNA